MRRTIGRLIGLIMAAAMLGADTRSAAMAGRPFVSRAAPGLVVVKLNAVLAAAVETALRAVTLDIRGQSGNRDVDALIARHRIRTMQPLDKEIVRRKRRPSGSRGSAEPELVERACRYLLDLDLRGRDMDKALLDLRLDPDVDEAEPAGPRGNG